MLRMRFGMYDGRTHTLEEVGQIFGVTRERIRQIENKAIRKLRHPSAAQRKSRISIAETICCPGRPVKTGLPGQPFVYPPVIGQA